VESGGSLLSEDDDSGALELQERVLAVWSQAFPDDHPNLQLIRSQVGATCFALGHHARARTLLERAVQAYSARFGPDHPSLLAAREGLAGVLLALGHAVRARELFESVREERSRGLPEGSPLPQTTRCNLAAALFDLGELPRARRVLEEALETARRPHGDDHPAVETAREMLAAVLYAHGEHERARELIELVLESRSRSNSRTSGWSSPRYVTTASLGVRRAEEPAPAARRSDSPCCSLARAMRPRPSSSQRLLASAIASLPAPSNTSRTMLSLACSRASPTSSARKSSAGHLGVVAPRVSAGGAVLSACETAVGIRRSGQGVASLQKALHMAGARSVVTSLWKVPDEATRELMVDFYRRVWIWKQPKNRALWQAKEALRAAKDSAGTPLHSTHAWAAWVLTGDPR
jgi:tetratricopeptide (TPR) repeat protein